MRIQEFSSGGLGQSDNISSDKVFFFESSAYFTRFKWLISKKTIIFQGSRGGPRGGGGGGAIAYSL